MISWRNRITGSTRKGMKYMEKNLSFPAEQVQSVRVKLTWAQVEVITGSSDAFHVHIAGHEESVDEINVEMMNNALLIAQPQYTVAKEMMPRKRWLQIYLRVPEGWNRDMDIATVSGILGVRKVNGDDIALTTVSGQMNIQHVSAGHLGIRSASGAVSGDAVAVKHLYIRTISGKVALSDVQSTTCKVFTVSADVSLKLGKGGRSLDMQSISGNINLEVEGAIKEASLHSLSGQFILSDEMQKSEDGLDITSSSISGSLSVKGRSL